MEHFTVGVRDGNCRANLVLVSGSADEVPSQPAGPLSFRYDYVLHDGGVRWCGSGVFVPATGRNTDKEGSVCKCSRR